VSPRPGWSGTASRWRSRRSSSPGQVTRKPSTTAAAIRAALQALAAGRLAVPIDSAVPLKQVNEAFERITQRSVHGKLVLHTRI
jgi:NADPH:quinone reductase-like Zn-dependent oxidoreductase